MRTYYRCEKTGYVFLEEGDRVYIAREEDGLTYIPLPEGYTREELPQDLIFWEEFDPDKGPKVECPLGELTEIDPSHPELEDYLDAPLIELRRQK